jgi:excisionase family DNA binding protein
MNRSTAREPLAPNNPQVIEDDFILSGYPLALTVTQAADVLGITPSRTRELLRRGLLPGIRLGNLWRIPRTRLEAMLMGDDQ